MPHRNVFFTRQGRLGGRIVYYATTNLTPYREKLVGLGRFELPTSPLSGVRSNQLSYKPIFSVYLAVLGVEVLVHTVMYKHTFPHSLKLRLD